MRRLRRESIRGRRRLELFGGFRVGFWMVWMVGAVD